ncbi:MAG: DUF4405 domain-containing protein [Anaerolineae bacterium]|nr:DUF4405 domain-containing protein [Anaerolineae bacterium]
MLGKTKLNFWLDLTIFITFVITTITGLLLWLVIPSGSGSGWLVFYGLTRREWVELHNWFGVGMLLGITFHLILHWRWIICVVQRFFGRLAQQARVNFFLDSVLFALFFLTNLSGLVAWLVLPAGGYRGGRNPYYNASLLGWTRHDWNDLHLWASLVMIGIVVLHLVLHWNWIVCTVRRYAQATLYNPGECTAQDLTANAPRL